MPPFSPAPSSFGSGSSDSDSDSSDSSSSSDGGDTGTGAGGQSRVGGGMSVAPPGSDFADGGDDSGGDGGGGGSGGSAGGTVGGQSRPGEGAVQVTPGGKAVGTAKPPEPTGPSEAEIEAITQRAGPQSLVTGQVAGARSVTPDGALTQQQEFKISQQDINRPAFTVTRQRRPQEPDVNIKTQPFLKERQTGSFETQTGKTIPITEVVRVDPTVIGKPDVRPATEREFKTFRQKTGAGQEVVPAPERTFGQKLKQSLSSSEPGQFISAQTGTSREVRANIQDLNEDLGQISDFAGQLVEKSVKQRGSVASQFGATGPLEQALQGTQVGRARQRSRRQQGEFAGGFTKGAVPSNLGEVGLTAASFGIGTAFTAGIRGASAGASRLAAKIAGQTGARVGRVGVGAAGIGAGAATTVPVVASRGQSVEQELSQGDLSGAGEVIGRTFREFGAGAAGARLGSRIGTGAGRQAIETATRDPAQGRRFQRRPLSETELRARTFQNLETSVDATEQARLNKLLKASEELQRRRAARRQTDDFITRAVQDRPGRIQRGITPEERTIDRGLFREINQRSPRGDAISKAVSGERGSVQASPEFVDLRRVRLPQTRTDPISKALFDRPSARRTPRDDFTFLEQRRLNKLQRASEELINRRQSRRDNQLKVLNPRTGRETQFVNLRDPNIPSFEGRAAGRARATRRTGSPKGQLTQETSTGRALLQEAPAQTQQPLTIKIPKTQRRTSARITGQRQKTGTASAVATPRVQAQSTEQQLQTQVTKTRTRNRRAKGQSISKRSSAISQGIARGVASGLGAATISRGQEPARGVASGRAVAQATGTQPRTIGKGRNRGQSFQNSIGLKFRQIFSERNRRISRTRQLNRRFGTPNRFNLPDFEQIQRPTPRGQTQFREPTFFQAGFTAKTLGIEKGLSERELGKLAQQGTRLRPIPKRKNTKNNKNAKNNKEKKKKKRRGR